jgi:hypothetical protein
VLTPVAVPRDPFCAEHRPIFQARFGFANNAGNLCYPCLPSLLAYIYKEQKTKKRRVVGCNAQEPAWRRARRLGSGLEGLDAFRMQQMIRGVGRLLACNRIQEQVASRVTGVIPAAATRAENNQRTASSA